MKLQRDIFKRRGGLAKPFAHGEQGAALPIVLLICLLIALGAGLSSMMAQNRLTVLAQLRSSKLVSEIQTSALSTVAFHFNDRLVLLDCDGKSNNFLQGPHIAELATTPRNLPREVRQTLFQNRPAIESLAIESCDPRYVTPEDIANSPTGLKGLEGTCRKVSTKIKIRTYSCEDRWVILDATTPFTASRGGRTTNFVSSARTTIPPQTGTTVVRLGINFEDLPFASADKDYNDSVLCFQGQFEVTTQNLRGRAGQKNIFVPPFEVVSLYDQDVLATDFSSSGCEHTVKLTITDPVTGPRPAISYEDGKGHKQLQTRTLHFKKGSKLRMDINSGGGCVKNITMTNPQQVLVRKDNCRNCRDNQCPPP